MSNKTFAKKLAALRQQAMQEQTGADRSGQRALSWAWWAIIDALDAALSVMTVIENMKEQ